MSLDTRRQEDIVMNQQAIENLDILILGCGAVGSVMTQILARMGVGQRGTITLADGDDVEDHNITRQLYDSSHINWNKALATEQQVEDIDSDVNTEAIPRHVFVDEGFSVSEYDVVVSAIDSLFVEQSFYEACCDEEVAFVSPRMSGYTVELFAHWPWSDEHVDANNDVYFRDSLDKEYGEGASCSGDVDEDEVAAISTTTNIVSGLAAQAVLAWTQGWSFDPAPKFSVRRQFEEVEPIEV